MLRIPVSDRTTKAMQARPQNKRLQEMQARAEELRQNYELECEKQRQAFRGWEETDRFLQFLEETRDQYAPKSPEEEWHPIFRMAIEMIPDYRSRARELWLDYAANP